MKNIRVEQVHTDTLSCEPILRKTANGELLCVCQCGDVDEPAPLNRVYFFHSKDDGKTWSNKQLIYPEVNKAVYCTEVSVYGDEIIAYLTIHEGGFLTWKCVMVKSYDNGYTWKYSGSPLIPEYTFFRGAITTSDGIRLIPYQFYPIGKENYDRAFVGLDTKDPLAVVNTGIDYCESGVLRSEDDGKTYTRYDAVKLSFSEIKAIWSWNEPTIVELSDKRILMLMRRDTSGYLWRSESKDGGKTWTKEEKTDITNPSNKPKLIKLDNNRIALIHTPNPLRNGARYPLELWVSQDDCKTWDEKIIVCDFPGNYSYSDGFYEDGHIKFTVEHNRHTILFFDVEIQ